MGRAKTAARYTAAAIAGLTVAALLVMATPSPGTGLVPAQATGDLLDLPNANVADANFGVLLVHQGTEQPYTGNGAPGIHLTVRTPGNVLGWTLKGWANETTPPQPPQVCTQSSIFFDSYDWLFQSDGGDQGADGVFITKPSTTLERIGPSGDQCLARLAATGVWTVTVCIEGKPGGPRGLYDSPDGRHFDAWDRCITQAFQVSL
jgi:hypothetical protein